MSRKIYLRAMTGIGDNLYARPFVKDAASRLHVSLMTGFPQLFSDIRGIRLVRAQTSIPYIQENIRFWGETNDWRGVPRVGDIDSPRMEPHFLRYDPDDADNVTAQIEREFPLQRPYNFDLPAPIDLGEGHSLKQLFRQKYVVIRPVVVRPGFGTTARNALPGYIYSATEEFKRAGYTTVVVANLGDAEMAVSPLPEGDINWTQGQLNIAEMIEVFRYASAVVSGPGFGMPMAVAARRPLLAIWGARGKLDNPKRIFDPRMDLSRVTNAIPENFCKHSTGECDCYKIIPDFNKTLKGFIQGLTDDPR